MRWLLPVYLCFALGLSVVLAIPSQDTASQGGQAASDASENEDGVEPLEWPRFIEKDGHQLVMHQPQIDRWTDYELLSARAAVAVVPKGATEPDFGAIRFTAPTTIDFENRAVEIGRRTIAGSRFPDTEASRFRQVRRIVERLMPGREPMVMSLDEIVPYLDLESHAMNEVPANLEPPPIYLSREPAILLMFLKAPRFDPLESTGLEFAVNTNWDLIRDPATGRNYLLDEDRWLTTADPASGPWVAASTLPESFQRIPANEEWEAVKARVPGKPATSVPKVIVAYEPSELIVTEGVPRLETIGGTPLQVITNTEADLFYNLDDEQYYLLAAGRWFRAKRLEGPWSAATRDLPAAFGMIPPSHPSAHVLASVPNTPESKSAVLLASMPRKATIFRNEATADPVYDGEPQWRQISGSQGVETAVNTAYDVFRVDGQYYCCYEGVWFTAGTANGPWQVCDHVPPALYTIPSYDPKHNVTYVRVYDTSDETVTVGQTGGYTGEVITLGLIMAGVGYALLQADNVNFSGSIRLGTGINISWGSGARYDPRRGGYVNRGRRYGPYAGLRSSGLDRRVATRSMSPAQPYARWGRAAMPSRQFARSGSAAFGRSGRAAGIPRNDLYAGADGNVYRRDDGGDWMKRGGKDWQKLDRSNAQRLNGQFEARQFGTTRARDFRRSGGGGGRTRRGGRR